MGRLLRWSQRKPAVAALTAVLAIVTFVGSSAFAWQYQKTVTANHELMVSQVEGLRGASAEGTRELLKTLAQFGSQAVPDLREARSEPDLSDSQRTRYAIALLPYDRAEVDYLFNRLPDADVDDTGLICEALLPHADELKQQLWKSVKADKVATSTQLRLAAALAVFDPESDDWKKIAKDVVASLTELDQIEARRWVRSLLPGRKWLLPEFESLFETSENQSNRVIAAHAMVHFLESDSDQLVELLRIADIRQLPIIVTALKQGGSSVIEKLESLAQLRPNPSEEDVTTICNAAVTLAQLDRPEVLWSLLENDVSPDVKVQLIHTLAPSGVAPGILSEQLTEQNSPAVRYRVLLALGEYETFQTTSRFRDSVASRVKTIHKEDPDSGVHSAAKWLLRKWGVRDFDRQPQPLVEDKNWFVDKFSQTFIVSRGSKTFTTESLPDETTQLAPASPIEVQINHSFAVADSEVTVRLWERFQESLRHDFTISLRHDFTIGPDLDCPVNSVSANEVAAFCRWLTHQEGMTEDDMCFPPVDVHASKQVIPYEDFLSRAGYRPPTEAEWEYMCRAGSVSDRFTGSSVAMLKEYAWFEANSNQRTWPVGTLKPNAFGMFDVYGNVREMAIPTGGVPAAMNEPQVVITCGETSFSLFGRIRSVSRNKAFSRGFRDCGVRVARTIPSN